MLWVLSKMARVGTHSWLGAKGSGILLPGAAPILTQLIPACLSSLSEGASLPIEQTVWICTNHFQADDLRNIIRKLIAVTKLRNRAAVPPGPLQSHAKPLCQVPRTLRDLRQPCLWGYGQCTVWTLALRERD